jgi:hypothetical protein
MNAPLTGKDRERRFAGPFESTVERRRWLSLAASIVSGVFIGSVLWVTGPRATLAREVIAHVAEERQSFASDAANTAAVAAILRNAGVRLRDGVGTVSYAHTCPFRGQQVPHLVVRTDQGPVTVLVLHSEKLRRPITFDERGYVGSIVPAGPGSIAVLGDAHSDVQQVVARLLESVEWIDEAGATSSR